MNDNGVARIGFSKGIALTFWGVCFGFVSVTLTLALLASFFWVPYQTELRSFGFEVDDIALAYGLFFSPLFFGSMFGILTALLLIIGKLDWLWFSIAALAILPVVLVVGLEFYSFVGPMRYSYPGKEAAIFVSGLSWSFLLRLFAK